MQDVSLDLDKENELIFKLSVEGTKPATVKNRLLLETNDFSLVFPAKSLEDGDISISIPPLENMIPEGLYVGSLEVIIDDKVFTPMKIQADFKKSVKVVAEVVTRRESAPRVSVSSVVTVNKATVDTTVRPTNTHARTLVENDSVEEDTLAQKLLERSNKKMSKSRDSHIKDRREQENLLEQKIRKIAKYIQYTNIVHIAQDFENLADMIMNEDTDEHKKH